VIEIGDNKIDDDEDELALIPHSSRIGLPSTSSPVKALVLF
jgi:hypothetical protein